MGYQNVRIKATHPYLYSNCLMRVTFYLAQLTYFCSSNYAAYISGYNGFTLITHIEIFQQKIT